MVWIRERRRSNRSLGIGGIKRDGGCQGHLTFFCLSVIDLADHCIVQSFWSAVIDDPAAVDSDHPVAVFFCIVELVQIGDNCYLISVIHLLQGFHDLLCADRIEGGDGFIRQDDLRLLGQSPCDRNPLHLSA